MRIGRLRHRITIQRWTETLNKLNEPVEDWQDYVTVWAQAEDLRGREYHLARQAETGEVTTRFRIRYRSDIDRAKMRVVDGSRTFGIEAVIEPDGKRRVLEMMCKEVDTGEN